jgi:molybdate-binding protein/molybdenum-dependent DNA-binding transcriptional regulator ModE
MKIEIEPIWRFTQEGNSESLLLAPEFLNSIQITRTISEAADLSNLSLRHALNLLDKWSAFFGSPLVDHTHGPNVVLTPLGTKLVWAGQLLHARLGPQLQNFAQELEEELRELLPSYQPVLRVHASHGFAVAKLRELLLNEKDLGVDLRYATNQSSLVSLAQEGCELAGMHLPIGELRRRSVDAAKDWLIPSVHRVIGFVTREIGLIVQPGNPLGIISPTDLANRPVRFVNRDLGSGTRVLFDYLLEHLKLNTSSINGYTRTESTHATVAACVASDIADVGFGVKAAAYQYRMGFIPLITEDYFFVCRKQLLETVAMKRVLAIMQGEEFRAAISELPGYSASDPGEVKTVSLVFHP